MKTNDVTFDVDGKPYTLRFGTNEHIRHTKALAPLTGVEHFRYLVWAALTSAPGQETLTLEEAGDLVDEIGVAKMDDLIGETAWGQRLKKDAAAVEARTEAENSRRQADEELRALVDRGNAPLRDAIRTYVGPDAAAVLER